MRCLSILNFKSLSNASTSREHNLFDGQKDGHAHTLFIFFRIMYNSAGVAH